MQTMITWADFEAVDLRAGTIVRAEPFPEARKPAYKLWIDLGQGALRQSSAQITDLYQTEALVGKQVLVVCNFPPKQIGPWMSEVLVCGFVQDNGSVVLAVPDSAVADGTKLR
ncbi:MAG: tRNA-binding protein [Candidatus Kapaibacteriota bacterium]